MYLGTFEILCFESFGSLPHVRVREVVFCGALLFVCMYVQYVCMYVSCMYVCMVLFSLGNPK